MWISYRCFAAKGEERVPLFGDFGLVNQLGSSENARPRSFRERLGQWLGLGKVLWQDCPIRISSEGRALIVSPAEAILASGGERARA